MKKIYFTLLLAILIATSATAQQKKAVMSFTNTKHDFGEITQKGGVVKHKFIFTNTGGTPINISRVKTTCGCTTPTWTKSPIKPGEKGEVQVAFDPANRPGYFTKKITVLSTASNNPVTLTITGNVDGKPKPEIKYTQQIGDLKTNKLYVNFGNMNTSETEKVMKVKMYNPTAKDLNIIVEDKYKPKYTKVIISPETLKPDAEGTITIKYNASQVNDWDYVRGYIYLTINGQRVTNKKIQVAANIKEYFSEEQKQNSPIIEFDEKIFDFDTVNEGQKIVHEFTFKNVGKSDLLIRKTRTSCGCTAVSLSRDPVKPGETGSIKATFNTNHKLRRQSKSITVVTNCADAQYNRVILKIKGYVIPKASPKNKKVKKISKPKEAYPNGSVVFLTNTKKSFGREKTSTVAFEIIKKEKETYLLEVKALVGKAKKVNYKKDNKEVWIKTKKGTQIWVEKDILKNSFSLKGPFEDIKTETSKDKKQ